MLRIHSRVALAGLVLGVSVPAAVRAQAEITERPTLPRTTSTTTSTTTSAVTSAAHGRYRVTLNGFSVGHETWDDALQLDGKRDEIYFSTDVQVVDKLNNTLLPSSKRSLTFGDVNGFGYRVQAGSASNLGGIQTGDQVFGSAPWLRSGALAADRLPMVLWEGDLVDGQNAVAVIVTPWEYDGGQDAFSSWASWMQKTSQTLKSSSAFTTLIGQAGKVVLELADLGLGLALSLQENGVLGNAYDRPIGITQSGTVNGTVTYGFGPKILDLNYKTAELALANSFGFGNGIIGIRYVDAPKFAGDYTLYVQVERIP